MKKRIVLLLLVGIMISVSSIIVCLVVNDWRWIYAAFMIGIVFTIASFTSAWAPKGGRRRSIGPYARHAFDEAYSDYIPPKNAEKKVSNAPLFYCLCLGLPNLIIPIVVQMILSAHGN